MINNNITQIDTKNQQKIKIINSKQLITQLRILQARTYMVNCIKDNIYKEKPYPFWKAITADEVLKNVHVMKRFNEEPKERKNIIIKPVDSDFDYWLIDDVSKEKTEEVLSKYKVCLIIETSPENYQIIIKTKKIQLTGDPDKDYRIRKIKNTVCRKLNQQYGDPKILAQDHFFRLVCFLNTKEKYLNTLGYSPLVTLKYYDDAMDNIEMKNLILDTIPEVDQEIKNNTIHILDPNELEDIEDIPKEIKKYVIKCYKRQITYYQKAVDFSRVDWLVLQRLVITKKINIDSALYIIQTLSPEIENRHSNVEKYLEITKRNFIKQFIKN